MGELNGHSYQQVVATGELATANLQPWLFILMLKIMNFTATTLYFLPQN